MSKSNGDSMWDLNIEKSTFEELRKDPRMKNYGKAIDYLEENAGKRPIFPQKYLASQKYSVKYDTIKLRSEFPQLKLNQVVASIINNLSEIVPPDMIIELTKTIIETWEREEAKMKEQQLKYVIKPA